MNLNLVYCLAGKGARFVEQGITLPKYLLPLENGDTILESSIKNLKLPIDTKIIFLINEAHKEYNVNIVNLINKYNYNIKLIYISDTKGQAETAYLANQYLMNDGWVFYFNGDTILCDRNLCDIYNYLNTSTELSGYIDVFTNKSTNYSYVKSNKLQHVTEIVEKKVISNLATSGLYGFKNYSLYNKYYESTKFHNSEMYISDIYNAMLQNNEIILCSEPYDLTSTIILGTPQEYKKNKKYIEIR